MQHWQLQKMHESEIDERNMAFSIQDTHKSNPVLRNQAISLHTPKTAAFDIHKILKPITPVPPRSKPPIYYLLPPAFPPLAQFALASAAHELCSGRCHTDEPGPSKSIHNLPNYL